MECAIRYEKNIDDKNAVISGYALVAAELDKMKQYADSAKGWDGGSGNEGHCNTRVCSRNMLKHAVKQNAQWHPGIQCAIVPGFCSFFSSYRSFPY